jgi:hypothetical protein
MNKRCMLCGNKLKFINEFSYKDVFLISFAEVESYNEEDGCSLHLTEDFLCCKECYKNCGEDLKNELIKKKNNALSLDGEQK